MKRDLYSTATLQAITPAQVVNQHHQEARPKLIPQAISPFPKLGKGLG
jgi:hypothetical protein